MPRRCVLPSTDSSETPHASFRRSKGLSVSRSLLKKLHKVVNVCACSLVWVKFYLTLKFVNRELFFVILQSVLHDRSTTVSILLCSFTFASTSQLGYTAVVFEWFQDNFLRNVQDGRCLSVVSGSKLDYVPCAKASRWETLTSMADNGM